MNDNNTFDRRCSFNIAQGISIAESTNLNGGGFSWGSVSTRACSSPSFKNRPSKLYCNDEINANSKNGNLSKIDARIAADVQSNGLASRIVKYQESGTRLNRSMSAHNLFNKPGQFPTITLKKRNLPYRAAKRELSMIRIPPPDKSSFYGNTVSSLLRSSSVIGLESKQNEDISTENRPIIHPPPTENDMAPTRSVLDVLKEISRKRINSDELESEETSKKYCRSRNDFMDAVANENSSVQEKYLASLSSPRQRHKRQRDCIKPQQCVSFLESKTSPEQAKKRICNYNNDITSSLSSSIKSKKIPTIQNLNQTLPTYFQLNETHNLTDQHNFVYPKNNSKHVDIISKNPGDNWKSLETFNYITHTSETSDRKNSTIASQSFASEKLFNSDGQPPRSLTHAVQKPRLTLFNKKFDDSAASKGESHTYEFEESNEYDCTGIPFVKPKRIISNRGIRNPVIERTQKSKLALMLSGLRGELYHYPDLGVLDSSYEKEEHKTCKTNNSDTLASPSETSTSIPTSTTITSTTIVTSTSNVETKTNVKTTLSSTPSPLVGLKLKSSNEHESNRIRADSAKNTDLQSKSSVPFLYDFSTCATSFSSTPVAQSCSSLQTQCKSSSAQIPTIPINNSTETTTVSSSSFTSCDKINEISEKLQLPVNTNLIEFPGVCTAEILSTSHANTASTSSTSTVGKTFNYVSNLNKTTTDSCTLSKNNLPVIATSSISAVSSTPVMFGIATGSTANPINVFNFSTPTSLPISAPSSSVSTVFGVSTNSANLPKTISTSESAVRSSKVEHKVVGCSEKSSNTGSLNFNTHSQSSISEIEKCSGVGISSLSFNVDKNKDVASVGVFDSNTNSINFKFDTKSKISLDEINQKPENKDFNCNSPIQFNSQCLNTTAMGSSISVFDNVTRNSDCNIFKPSVISPAFGPVKADTDIHDSNSHIKSEVLVAPTAYGDDKINKSIPFSFVSNTTTFAATSSSNVNTHAGGFSFSSVASNNNKEIGPTDSLNHTFRNTSASQNNFVFGPPSNELNSSSIFGVSTNKPESISQGGFSFGAATPIKSSTFTFGADKTIKSDAINNSSIGFSFSASADTKQNVLSTNKPFSFGSPQSVQEKQPGSSSTGNSFNIFGLSGASKTAQPPTFNFTSGSAQSKAATNIFAPPILNVTAGPGDRPIRRATRRLQK